MSAKELGFIGVGRMGNHMAGRLLEAGYAVTIYDTNETAMQRLEQRGAKRAKSAADVAAQCETVLVSLPTPDIVKAVALGRDGVIAGGKAKVFVDLSTTGPRIAKEVAAGLAKEGITAIDAPVSGGPSGAEKGTLAMMIAGPKALAEELRPVIEVLGKFFYIGDAPGAGQTMKVINNLLSATAVTITSEAMVMGVKAGLDPSIMLDVINAGSGRNTATADKFPRCVLNRRFDFGFTTGLLYKDIKLCLDEAEALGVPMIVGNAVRQMMAIGKAAQGPDADITEFVKPLEKLAGVEVGEEGMTVKHTLLAALLLVPTLAHAEVDVVKIPKGAGGVGFLPLVVMEEKKLVEAEAQKMGLKLAAEYIKFGGPSVVNDMLLSGNAHFAPAGPPAFITLWDKTASNMKVHGVAAMTSIPMYLNTKAPHLKSLKDLTANDKIAVTAVKVSIPSIVMQMAALKEFGKADYAHYDPYTVSLTHPDGVIALLSGRSEITAHFTSPPFHQRERKDAGVHTVTTTNAIMGGPSTFTMLYAPAKFHDENPKAYAAVLAALKSAIDFINADKKAAAEVYLQSDEGKGWKMDDLMAVLNDPDIRFTTSPESLMTYANFMADVGSIKQRPQKWQDMFFPEIHGVTGN